MIYGYTDRIPLSWQIAVDRNSEKGQHKIDYPLIDVFYMEPKILDVGADINQIENVNVKVFNRDRTRCDILRHENKIEREVFSNAIQIYVKDPKKRYPKISRIFQFIKSKE